MAEESRGKRRKQANPRRNQDVEKLTALGSEGEDGGVPWGTETHDVHDKSSLTPSESTEPASPAHCANSRTLSPAHGWTGGSLNTSTPGEREGERDRDELMIYSGGSDHTASEDLAHYDFLMQLRQAPILPEGHAHNGATGVYHATPLARQDSRPPCWSPGKQDSPEGQEALPASPDAQRSPLACPFCQRTYRRDGALREHMRFCQERDGGGGGRLVCPLCGYVAPYRAQMERHVAMHGLEQSKHPSMYHPATENRKFKCLQCGKAFKYKHHLKEHLRIHSGEKPYECANCKKRFSHSGSYSSHLSSKKCLSGGLLNGQVYATYLNSSSPGSPPAGNGRNSGKGSPYAFPSPGAQQDRAAIGQPEQALLEASRLQGLWDPASELYRADLFKCYSLLPYLHSRDKFSHVLQEMMRRGGPPGGEEELVGGTGGGEGGAKREEDPRGAEPAGGGGGVTCRWCSQLFPSRAVLAQHERYLCRMNRDAVEALERPPQGRGRASPRAPPLQEHHAHHQANGFGRERSPTRPPSSWLPLPQRCPLLRHPDPTGLRPLWPAQEGGSPAPAHHPPASPASPSFPDRRHGTPRGFGSPLCLDLSVHQAPPPASSSSCSSPPGRPTPPCGTPSSAGSQNEPLDLSLPKPRWAPPGDHRPCNGASPPADGRPTAAPVHPPPGAYAGTPVFGAPVYSAFPLFSPIMPGGPLGGVGHQDGLSPLSLNPASQNSAPFLPPLPYMLESEAFLKRVHQEQQTLMSEAMSRGCLDYLSLMEDGGEGEGGAGRKRLKKTDEGLYACDICDKTFQKSSSLLRHKYEHTGKRPHECGICSKAFKHKHHLIEHSRLHSGEKPYQCDKCGKRFSHSGSYSQHMNHRYSHCGRDPETDPDALDLPTPPGLSLCRPRSREPELGGAKEAEPGGVQEAELGGAEEEEPGGASFLSAAGLDGGVRAEEEEEDEGEERTERGAGPGVGGAPRERSPLTRGEELSGEDGSGAGLGAGLEARGTAEAGEADPPRERRQDRDDGDRSTG